MDTCTEDANHCGNKVKAQQDVSTEVLQSETQPTCAGKNEEKENLLKTLAGNVN